MTRIFTLLFFVLISWSSSGQSPAGVYLGTIGEQYKKISHEVMSYTSAVNHGKSARKVAKRRVDLMEQIKESETIVRRMKPFEGKTTLRDSIAAYFKLSAIVLNRDYGKILDLEDIAEQSYDAMEAYLLAKEKANEKLDEASDAARLQYEAFAAANNIKLVASESELSSKLAKAGEVSHYANQTYLLFFKSYKNESFMMDAINRNDLTAIESSRNALIASTTEDLAKVPALGSFNGDSSLPDVLVRILNFYKTEASEKMKAHTEYLIAKDNFDKLKKTMDNTPASKRTKESVAAYNKAVEDFNAKVNASNAMHQDLNKKRSAVLKDWNETYETFLDKHTPKYK